MKSSDSENERSLAAWTLALAQPTISPAGGSAAAITGALAASLVTMVAGHIMKRERYADAHAEAARIKAQAERLRTEFLELASADARALAELEHALALPAGNEAERLTRDAAKHRALAEGARVQLEVARGAADITDMGEHLARVAPSGAAFDAATAVFLAAATARSAYWAARCDLDGTGDDNRELMQRAEEAQQRVDDLLTARSVR